MFILFGEMSVQDYYIAHFLIGCSFSYCPVLRFLCIFWVSLLSEVTLANTFSQSVICFLILFTVYYTKQEFLFI